VFSTSTLIKLLSTQRNSFIKKSRSYQLRIIEKKLQVRISETR